MSRAARVRIEDRDEAGDRSALEEVDHHPHAGRPAVALTVRGEPPRAMDRSPVTIRGGVSPRTSLQSIDDLQPETPTLVAAQDRSQILDP